MVDWLEKNARGVSWGIMRCERWGLNSDVAPRRGPRGDVSYTEAHTDHIHIGLSWAGARKRTSFWAPR